MFKLFYKLDQNISFVAKIITAVLFAFIIIFATIYYVSYKNFKNTLLQEQANKINILLNTISPSVQLNLEFNILENIDITFTQLLESNPEIKAIKLIGTHNNIIRYKAKTKHYNNIIVRTKPLIDKITKKTVAYLKISYSNKAYLTALYNFQKMFLIMVVVFIIFISIFMKLLLYTFKPLKQISHDLENYDPKNVVQTHLNIIEGKNEIAIINNALINMINKINSHTETLQEQVQIEIQKNAHKEQFMLQQSRLAQIGEMISMIAHQWRQPLTSISSTISALELRIMIDEYDEEYFTKELENISNYSQYLSATINDFRNFFKSNDTRSHTTMDEIINNSLNIIKHSINNKGIEIRKNITTINKIFTYQNEIQQVIINILKNAEDILIDENIKNPYIQIEAFEDDINFTIQISDNAGGIPGNIIDKIFDPYFTTKEKKDGTGLGLYMSKRIIESRCKGELSVSNNTNGAIFKILLPKEIDNE